MFVKTPTADGTIAHFLRFSYSVRSDSPTPPANLAGMGAYSPAPGAWDTRKTWTTATVTVQKDDETTTHFIHTYRHEEYIMTDTTLDGDLTAPTDALNDREPLTFSPDQPEPAPTLSAEQEAEAVETVRGADAVVDLDAEVADDSLDGYVLLAEVPAHLTHGGTILYDRVIKAALDGLDTAHIGTLKIIKSDETLKLVMAETGYVSAGEVAEDEVEGDSGLGLDAIFEHLFGGRLSPRQRAQQPQSFEDVLREMFGEAFPHGVGGEEPLIPGVFKPGQNLAEVREAVKVAVANDPDHTFGFHVHQGPLALFELLADVWSGDNHAQHAAIANGCAARLKGEDRERMCQTFDDLDAEAFLDAMVALENFTPPPSKAEVKSSAYVGVMSLGFNLLLKHLSPESQDAQTLMRAFGVPLAPEQFADVLAHFVNDGVVKEEDDEFRLSPRGQVLKGFQALMTRVGVEANDSGFTVIEVAAAAGLTETQTAKALKKLAAGNYVEQVEATGDGLDRWTTNV
ncbi:hypothetical protein BAJUN_00490 [Bajunvirus bajun]|uniref:Uncharacterized protein n=1 Tax=Brevundimonas phage vB_BgoS-Bajun TaxID=2948594 RepID=A0A9E7N4L2_9CAUD|nr:hypothetical protein BAJUN_00490 [Brevundimonas phage vB_BgoS-Bajun]